MADSAAMVAAPHVGLLRRPTRGQSARAYDGADARQRAQGYDGPPAGLWVAPTPTQGKRHAPG